MNEADDTMKCVLKPLRRADYPASLTDAQFARLQSRLPHPACATTPSAAWTARPPSRGCPTPAVPVARRSATPTPRAASAACRARRRSPRKAVGRVRVGLTRRRLARRVPGAGTETKRSWRWCVKRSRGKVRAAFTRKGRVALVATSAARHGKGAMRPGARVCGGGLVKSTSGASWACAAARCATWWWPRPAWRRAARLVRRYLQARRALGRAGQVGHDLGLPGMRCSALEVAGEVRHQPVGGAVVAQHREPGARCPGGRPPRRGGRPARSRDPGPGGRRRPRSPRRRWWGRRRRRRNARRRRSGAAAWSPPPPAPRGGARRPR